MKGLNPYILALALVACFSVTSVAEAKSVTYSATLPQISAMATAPAFLTNTQMSVLYSATVTNADTGTVMNDGDTAQVGAHLTVSPKLHDYSDVSWFTTGSSMDSPYGNWGASAPAATCNANDYVFESQVSRSYGPYPGRTYSKIYESALVQPPAQTITTSSNLSCSTPAADGSETCTVQSAGPITVTVTFATTPGQFYGQETTRSISDVGSNPTWGPTGCANFSQAYTSGGGAVTFTVPQQDIPFSFTASPPANTAPNTPTLSCPAGGQVGNALSFSVQGTDPEGDQLRYGLDWLGGTSVSQWAPASGYVNNGTSQAVQKSWASSGTYTVRAVSQDAGGLSSAWTPGCQVVITDPPPSALLTASPSSVAYGGASTLQWSSSNATSCTGTNFNTGGAISGSVSTGALNANQSYTVSCTGTGGSASSNASVTVGAAPQADLTAGAVSPSSATVNSPVTFTATASNTGNAASGSFPMLFDIQNVTQVNSSYGPGLAAGASQSMSSSYTFSSAGTYNVRACANMNTSFTPIVSESDYSNNCGPYTAVTVGAAAAADLTAGSVSPSSATAGSPATFFAPASNIGNGASGSFPMLFQIQNSSSQDVALIDSTYGNALAPGGSQTMSVPYTFSAQGSYSVRACANYNTSWTAITTESNYGNNCGPWTTVTVGAAPAQPPPPSLSCTVSNTNPAVGTGVTYTASGGASPYTWTASDGYPINSQSTTAVRNFSTAGQYGMQVDSFGFSSGNCPVVTAGSATCASPSAKITANPMRVRKNDKSTLTWSATGVDTSCVISGPGGNLPVNPTSCLVSGSIQTLPITAQSVYTISCDNGESHDQVIVNLIPQFLEF